MAKRMSMEVLARELLREMCEREEESPPTSESMKGMISKWENNRKTPNQFYRHLLAAVLDASVDDLGLTEDPDFIW